MRNSLQRLALPLCAYLFIAVLLPALNGALSRPTFLEHCVAIAVVCSTLTIGITALHVVLARLTTRRTS